MRIKKFLTMSVAAVAVSGLFVLACGDDDDNTVTPTTTADGGSDTGTGADTGGGGTDAGGGKDAGGGTDSGGPEASTPGVTFHVTYAGTNKGAVTMALFTGAAIPPTPPPAAINTVQAADVKFPLTYTFPKDKIAPGQYLATCYLDVGGNNPSGSGPEDPKAKPQVITYTGADLTVEMQLNDPAPPDGGADGG